MRILLVEDEGSLRQQVTLRLEVEGFEVEASGDGKEGFYFASEYPFDAAIIDLGLPGMAGLEMIRRIRSMEKTLPILILTARSRWQDKVEALEAGADDYLAKPFQMEELLARLRALLRRAAGAASDILHGGPIAIDMKAQKAFLNGCEVDLTAFEYRMLEYLMKQKGRIVPKSELSDYLYPHDEDRESNVLEVLVGRLRRKLDPEGALCPIETQRGRGYRFTLNHVA